MELAVSTSIIALLAVGGLAVMQQQNESDRLKETHAKMAVIKDALEGFVRTYEHLPCPADPRLLDSDADFGKSGFSPLTIDYLVESGKLTLAQADSFKLSAAMTDQSHYNDTSKACVNNDMDNLDRDGDGVGDFYNTGAIPTRTLNISDELAYDGWGRKFSYIVSNNAGSPVDFQDIEFRGNLRVVDMSGTNKTNIDNPPPLNDGATYVMISHGANGHRVAWRKNFDYASATPADSYPKFAGGAERQNTNHIKNRQIYIQNEKTENFDDITLFGTKSVLVPPKRVEAPTTIDDISCNNAEMIKNDPSLLQSIYDVDPSLSDNIEEVLEELSNMCHNTPTGFANFYKPSDVAGLTLWLDATDPDGDGVEPADGNIIEEWVDKSNSGSSAESSGTSTAATYRASGIGGIASLDFDTSTKLEIADRDVPTTNEDITELSLFVVLSMDSISGSPPLIEAYNNDWKLYFDYDTTLNQITPAFLTDTTDSFFPSGSIQQSTAADPKEYLFSLILKNGATAITHINGQDQALTPDPELSQNLGSIVIGDGFDGYVGEILTYGRALQEREWKGVESYLLRKWNMSEFISPTSYNCPEGMIFGPSNANPEGGCRCPDGQQLIMELGSLDACNPNDQSVGKCEGISEAPDYNNSPSNIASMSLWLDSNDCTTIKLAEDSLGQKRVTHWENKGGGLVREFLNTTPSLLDNPRYILSSDTGNINAKSTIHFDYTSTPNFLKAIKPGSHSLGIHGKDRFTVMAVIKMPPATQWDPTEEASIFAVNDSVSGFNPAFALTMSKTSPRPGFVLPNSSVLGLSSPMIRRYNDASYSAIDENLIIRAEYKNHLIGNHGADVFVNGLEWNSNDVYSLSSPDTAVTLSPFNYLLDPLAPIPEMETYYIGTGNAGSNPFDGYIAELMVFPNILSATQLSKIENSYLSDKWGIAIGADGGTVPWGVANDLQLWLDGSDQSTMKNGNACADNLTADNTDVVCWVDKKNDQWFSHFHNSDLGVSPSVDPPQFSPSKPGIMFDSSKKHYLSHDNTNTPDFATIPLDKSAIASGATLFFVTTPYTIPSSKRTIFSLNNKRATGNIHDGGYGFRTHNSKVVLALFSGYDGNVSNGGGYSEFKSSPGINASNERRLTTIVTGSNLRFYKDGQFYSAKALTPTGTMSSGPDMRINIGSPFYKNSNDTDDHWRGYVHEVIAYNRALTATELDMTHNYLSGKWGLGGFNLNSYPGNPRFVDNGHRPHINDTNNDTVFDYGGTRKFTWFDASDPFDGQDESGNPSPYNINDPASYSGIDSNDIDRMVNKFSGGGDDIDFAIRPPEFEINTSASTPHPAIRFDGGSSYENLIVGATMPTFASSGSSLVATPARQDGGDDTEYSKKNSFEIFMVLHVEDSAVEGAILSDSIRPDMDDEGENSGDWKESAFGIDGGQYVFEFNRPSNNGSDAGSGRMPLLPPTGSKEILRFTYDYDWSRGDPEKVIVTLHQNGSGNVSGGQFSKNEIALDNDPTKLGWVDVNFNTIGNTEPLYDDGGTEIADAFEGVFKGWFHEFINIDNGKLSNQFTLDPRSSADPNYLNDAEMIECYLGKKWDIPVNHQGGKSCP